MKVDNAHALTCLFTMIVTLSAKFEKGQHAC